MKILEEAWSKYAPVAGGSTEDERRRLQFAFYAGASVVMKTLHDISSPGVAPNEGLRLIASIDDELDAHVAEVMKSVYDAIESRR